MLAAAVGFQVRGWTPFASTFAAFFSRAYDFVRMAAISRANLRLSGSHAGVSIGEDGPSQMALEDFASLRAVHNSTVLHSLRRQPDRAPGGRDGRPAGHLLPAHAAPQDARPHATRRGGADRRQPRRPQLRRRRGHDRGVRDHRWRGRAGGGPARVRGHPRARDRLLLDQADRRRDAPPGGTRDQRDRHRRGPLARGRPRRGGAECDRRRGRRAAAHQARRPRHAGVRRGRRVDARGGDRRRRRSSRPRTGSPPSGASFRESARPATRRGRARRPPGTPRAGGSPRCARSRRACGRAARRTPAAAPQARPHPPARSGAPGSPRCSPEARSANVPSRPWRSAEKRFS